MTDNKPQPDKNQAEPALQERIYEEAVRRAEALAKSFSLLECMHLEALGFYEDEEDDDDALRVSLNVLTGRRSKTTGTIHLEDLNEVLQDFLRERLPNKIEKQLWDEILSGANPEIDVTKLPNKLVA